MCGESIPEGEILVILMIEDVAGVNNLEQILKTVPGIGVVLFGEGDLSQELGVPRQYQHPEVLRHLKHVLEVGKAHNVAVGHPHVDDSNVAAIIEQGFRFLMTFPRRDFGALDRPDCGCPAASQPRSGELNVTVETFDCSRQARPSGGHPLRRRTRRRR